MELPDDDMEMSKHAENILHEGTLLCYILL